MRSSRWANSTSRLATRGVRDGQPLDGRNLLSDVFRRVIRRGKLTLGAGDRLWNVGQPLAQQALAKDLALRTITVRGPKTEAGRHMSRVARVRSAVSNFQGFWDAGVREWSGSTVSSSSFCAFLSAGELTVSVKQPRKYLPPHRSLRARRVNSTQGRGVGPDRDHALQRSPPTPDPADPCSSLLSLCSLV